MFCSAKRRPSRYWNTVNWATMSSSEIAKRSRGMLRWARAAERIGVELRNLGRALSGQLVLTFRLPDRCARPHRVQLAAGALISNALPLLARSRSSSAQGGAPAAGEKKETSPWRWIGLGALLLILVSGLAGMTYWLIRGMGGARHR